MNCFDLWESEIAQLSSKLTCLSLLPFDASLKLLLTTNFFTIIENVIAYQWESCYYLEKFLLIPWLWLYIFALRVAAISFGFTCFCLFIKTKSLPTQDDTLYFHLLLLICEFIRAQIFYCTNTIIHCAKHPKAWLLLKLVSSVDLCPRLTFPPYSCCLTPSLQFLLYVTFRKLLLNELYIKRSIN